MVSVFSCDNHLKTRVVTLESAGLDEPYCKSVVVNDFSRHALVYMLQRAGVVFDVGVIVGAERIIVAYGQQYLSQRVHSHALMVGVTATIRPTRMRGATRAARSHNNMVALTERHYGSRSQQQDLVNGTGLGGQAVWMALGPVSANKDIRMVHSEVSSVAYRDRVGAAVINAIFDVSTTVSGEHKTFFINGTAAVEALVLVIASILEGAPACETEAGMRLVTEETSSMLMAKLLEARALYEETGKRWFEAYEQNLN